MFYWLVDLSDRLSVLNVFRYITFRTGGAVITALLFVFLFGQNIIDRLRLLQGKGQPIRSDGPKSHIIAKAGTPTMGGLMILSGMLVSTLLWANPANPYVWVVLWVTLGFGFVGFYDDYLKVKKQTSNGFGGRTRLLVEAAIASLACYALIRLGQRDRISTVTGVSVLQGTGAEPRLVLRHLRGFHHRRRRQCGESDRRARWPRHRSGHDRGRKLRHDRLSLRQRGVRRLSADPLCRRHRRTRGAVRRRARRGPRLSLVQRAAGVDLHGRYRLARARRHDRHVLRSPPSTRSCSPSSAACSCSKRSR